MATPVAYIDSPFISGVAGSINSIAAQLPQSTLNTLQKYGMSPQDYAGWIAGNVQQIKSGNTAIDPNMGNIDYWTNPSSQMIQQAQAGLARASQSPGIMDSIAPILGIAGLAFGGASLLGSLGSLGETTATSMLADQSSAMLAAGFSPADVASSLAGLGDASQIAGVLQGAGIDPMMATDIANQTLQGIPSDQITQTLAQENTFGTTPSTANMGPIPGTMQGSPTSPSTLPGGAPIPGSLPGTSTGTNINPLTGASTAAGIAGILSGLKGITSGGITAEQARSWADPYMNVRGDWVNQLSDLVKNPQNYLSTPGAEFQVQQGQQALGAQLARGGYGASGNALIASQNLGQQQAATGYQNWIQQLQSLINPQAAATGTQAALSAQNSLYNINAQAWKALGQGAGALSGSLPSTMSSALPNAASYLNSVYGTTPTQTTTANVGNIYNTPAQDTSSYNPATDMTQQWTTAFGQG